MLLLAVSGLCATTHYVSLTCTNATPPYSNWVTAANNIQAAVNIAVAGDEIVVTNGIYDTGEQGPYGPNRVAVDKPLALRSINGPRVTVIQGGQPNMGLGGPRCAYLTNGAILSGFTLTGGSTGYGSFGDRRARTGGGVYCDPGGVLSNCVVYGNNAVDSGGGAQGGTLNNCTLSNNSALGQGGGAFGGVATDGNYIPCTLNNCKVTGNRAGSGGGTHGATLNNCTLTGNSAGGGQAGGAYDCILHNCIVYYNTATNGPNYAPNCNLSYCCSSPELPDAMCFDFDPGFVDYAGGNLRLRPDSGCIGWGNLDYVVGSTDLDGRPRTGDGWVDLGAYELQDGIPGHFIGWLEGYGLPTDGSVDFADSDGDGRNNWKEWVCRTCPTNAQSVLRLLSGTLDGANVTVTWQSVGGVKYFLERSVNLASPFALVATNILGQAGTTTCADTNANSTGPVFYRVGVNGP